MFLTLNPIIFTDFGTCMYDFCVLEVMDDMRLPFGVIWTDLSGKELV